MFSEEGEENKSISMSITKRKPDNSSWVGCELSDYDKKLIYLKVNRVFEYKEAIESNIFVFPTPFSPHIKLQF